MTWFVIRDDEGLRCYANTEFETPIPLVRLDEDVTNDFDVTGDDISVVALRDAKRTLVFVGNSAPHTITTRLRMRHVARAQRPSVRWPRPRVGDRACLTRRRRDQRRDRPENVPVA